MLLGTLQAFATALDLRRDDQVAQVMSVTANMHPRDAKLLE